MSGAEFSHQPVLLQEVIEALRVRPDGVYVDGTYGRGGHTAAILARLGDEGRLILMDKDPQAIERARHELSTDDRVTIIHDDYAQLALHIESLGLGRMVDGVLLDLGVSSPQLDDQQRGFSFQHNGPLDMRMDSSRGETAEQWINRADEKEIADVLWRFGEERHSRRIARRIVEARRQQPIGDTATLAALIAGCVPAGRERKHPATRCFQAIRMRINQELEHLKQVLDGIFDVLKVGGRLLVISFHSLEDRIVKRFFKLHATPPRLPRGLPVRDEDIPGNAPLRIIGRALKASPREIEQNPRSRSAILRTAERIC